MDDQALRTLKSIDLRVARIKNIEILIEQNTCAMEAMTKSHQELTSTLDKAWQAYEKLLVSHQNSRKIGLRKRN
jgi:hypothetical protein